MNRYVRRLQAVLRLDESLKGAVDDLENFPVAAKIRREPAFHTVLSFDDLLDDFEISLDVGATEGIDRLFWVAHDKYFSGDQFDLAPIHRRLAGLFGQIEENLIFDGIGVLKFVY